MVRFAKALLAAKALLIVSGCGACLLLQSAKVAQGQETRAADSGGGRERGRGFGFGGGRGMRGPWGRPPWMQQPEQGKKEEPAADATKPEPPQPKAEADAGPWRPEPVKRSPWPRWPANPAELNARPDEEGRIAFRFRGQPWTSVLEWLADISQMTLQWEATPEGYLDLAPRGKLEVSEVRELITSVLLSKGYALMRNGDVLIVADAKNFDIGLAPRASLSELQERGDHELVRVVFDLDWLLAEGAAEEFKPLLGPYGKINPLKTANRLDVLGPAGNLRRMHELLQEEQSASMQTRLVREFRLRHTRAADVLDKLKTLLGAGEETNPAQAMLNQMMSQSDGRDRRRRRDRDGERGDGQGMAQPNMAPLAPEPTPEFYLAVNARTNSILANAPPDKMAKIEQAVAVIDVPQARDRSLLSDLPRVQAFRLAAIDPATLVKVLNELGGLDPSTRLEIDAANNSLIAYGPLADQMLIRTLVGTLDGTSRRFEVIQLRTLSAEFVAGSIQTLLLGPEPSDDSRRRYSPEPAQNEADRFQVEADVEHNRLLLRANDAELAEIRSLLTKLGEIPAPGAKTSTLRVIPAMPGQETERLLEQIERLWPALGPNPLEVEADGADGESEIGGDAPNALPPESLPPESLPPESLPPESLPPESLPPESQEPNVQETDDAAAPEDETARASDPLARRSRFHFAQQSQAAPDERESPAGEKAAPAESEPMAAPSNSPPLDEAEPSRSLPGRDLPRAAHAPVRIAVGPYGLVISSADPQALDRLEELIGSFMPARLTYKVFTIKNTYAFDLALLLEEIYKHEEPTAGSGFDPFGDSRRSRGRGSEPPRNSLSRRRPLSFVADATTNTILVQGADANQLAEIESLIKLYDADDVPDAKSVRQTQLVSLRYAKAAEVAEVVKDVYRDLLSPNDKALERNVAQPQQREGGFRASSSSYLSEDSQASQNIPRFKGMLSIGIDSRSNGLAISAPQILLANVLEMVDRLDQAAKPTRAVVRIMKLRQPGSAALVERALAPQSGRATGESGAKTEPAPGATTPNGAPPGGFGRRGDGAAN